MDPRDIGTVAQGINENAFIDERGRFRLPKTWSHRFRRPMGDYYVDHIHWRTYLPHEFMEQLPTEYAQHAFVAAQKNELLEKKAKLEQIKSQHEIDVDGKCIKSQISECEFAVRAKTRSLSIIEVVFPHFFENQSNLVPTENATISSNDVNLIHTIKAANQHHEKSSETNFPHQSPEEDIEQRNISLLSGPESILEVSQAEDTQESTSSHTFYPTAMTTEHDTTEKNVPLSGWIAVQSPHIKRIYLHKYQVEQLVAFQHNAKMERLQQRAKYLHAPSSFKDSVRDKRRAFAQITAGMMHGSC